jgi:hypothetical protein
MFGVSVGSDVAYDVSADGEDDVSADENVPADDDAVGADDGAAVADIGNDAAVAVVGNAKLAADRQAPSMIATMDFPFFIIIV